MIFITEDDLRDLYKIKPFTEYEIAPGTRITPGARQFLADRGINMFDDDPRGKEKNASARKVSTTDDRMSGSFGRRLRTRMKSMEAMFLDAEEELLSKDVLLTQSVISLGRSFSGIKEAIRTGNSNDDVALHKCTGINEENFCDDMEDCFEITDFHIRLPKGREIVILHRLRCSLREIELDIEKFFDDCEDGNNQREAVDKTMHQIVNTLSQLICSAAGGEKCQKKT